MRNIVIFLIRGVSPDMQLSGKYEPAVSGGVLVYSLVPKALLLQ